MLEMGILNGVMAKVLIFLVFWLILIMLSFVCLPLVLLIPTLPVPLSILWYL